MTRINSDLDPRFLLDQHLMAEYRELPMVYAALRRSLRTKSYNEVLESVPKEFTLNKGHVLFFYDKLFFLSNRYAKLQAELGHRGYVLDANRTYSFDDFSSPLLFKDYKSTSKDLGIIKERILLRFNQKPTWYTYMHEKISVDTYTTILNKE